MFIDETTLEVVAIKQSWAPIGCQQVIYSTFLT
jgi:hypothetical protein